MKANQVPSQRPRVRMPKGERAEPIKFRLYPEDLEALDRIAATLPVDRRSRTAALRHALAQALETR